MPFPDPFDLMYRYPALEMAPPSPGHRTPSVVTHGAISSADLLSPDAPKSRFQTQPQASRDHGQRPRRWPSGVSALDRFTLWLMSLLFSGWRCW